MQIIGLFQAKTHLSQIVEQASRGECFTITKHGKPMARITPVDDAHAARMTPAEAADRIRQIQKRSTLGGLSVRDLIAEGRRW